MSNSNGVTRKPLDLSGYSSKPIRSSTAHVPEHHVDLLKLALTSAFSGGLAPKYPKPVSATPARYQKPAGTNSSKFKLIALTARSPERRAAAELGHTQYTASTPCKKCGTFIRYTSNSACAHCDVTRKAKARGKK